MQPAMGTAVSTNALSGNARQCRDCGADVGAYRYYCDGHRDLRRILTFLHQARLIAETNDNFNHYLAHQIRRVISEAEGLR